MSSFDIESLLSFSPPRFLCKRCCGLNSVQYHAKLRLPVCTVCNARYLSTESFDSWQYEKYLRTVDCGITFKDPIAHCQRLAGIARGIRSNARSETLLGLLLQSLAEAKQFVHFVSYGISWQFIGALKLAAQRISIRGVVANADQESVRELIEFRADAPKLHVHAFGQDKQLADVPHHKLILIDGLLAFKGSANLTLPGWRKAEKGLEMIDVVTDIDEVTRLNNEYFAPLWSQISDEPESINMKDDIPF